MAEIQKSTLGNTDQKSSEMKTEDLVLNAISDGKLTREEADNILERFKCEKENLEQNYNSCKIDISNETASKLLKLANESGFTQIVDKLKEKGITNEKLEETSFGYFGIKPEEFRQVQDTFEKYSFDFDFKSFLDGYKNYIEKNISGLDKSVVEKIKLSIKIKFLQITKILEGRIAFVDEQIKKGNYKSSDKENEIKNQRWIINTKLQENFSVLNNSVLPGAALLLKSNNGTIVNPYAGKGYLDTTGSKIYQMKNMFASKVNEDGDFDSRFHTKYNPNRVLDLSNDMQKNIGEDNSISIEELPSILNEEDKKIESNAQMAYIAGLLAIAGIDGLAFTGVGTGFSAIVGGTYSAIDAFTSEDFLLTMIKETGLIPDDYKSEKKWYDNALALLGIVPLAGEVLRLGKNTPKIAKFLSKLSPEKLALFNKMKAQISDKVDKKITELSGRFGLSKKVEGDDLATKMAKVEEKTGIPKEEVISNSKWFEEGKFDLPSNILVKNGEKPLTPEQLEVVKKVHLEISKGLYQNSTSDIMKMSRIMREAGINENQTRILMENGITGLFGAFRKNVEKADNLLEHFYRSLSNDKLRRFASNPDMEPKYKKIINGQEFLFTDRMNYGGRNYVFGYVRVGDNYEQRTFYFSQSGGNWHSCPGIRVEDGGYSKGEFANLSYEKGTIVNEKLSDFFESLQVKGIGYNPIDFLRGIFGDVSGSRSISYLPNSTEGKFLNENRVTTLNNDTFSRIDRNTSIQGVNQIMRNIDVSSIDLNGLTKIGESTQHHMWLGEVNIQRYRTTMRGRPIEIQYASTPSEPNKMWIENIFYADTNMNSYGLPTDSINAGLLTTKPLEYINQVTREISISGAKKFQGYVDIRDFIQENPLIRYFKSMSKENPNIQKYNQSELIKGKRITTDTFNIGEGQEVSLKLGKDGNIKITKQAGEYYIYSEGGKIFKLDKGISFVLGRENPYFAVHYDDVSRNHLTITSNLDGSITLRDHSTNGTYLN